MRSAPGIPEESFKNPSGIPWELLRILLQFLQTPLGIIKNPLTTPYGRRSSCARLRGHDPIDPMMMSDCLEIGPRRFQTTHVCGGAPTPHTI